jgi:hypothetical protein
MVERQLQPIPPEIASAFAWAAGAFSLSWSPGGPEPTTVLYGQHFTIMEVGHLVDNFTHPLPESLLDILYLAHASIGVDASALRRPSGHQSAGKTAASFENDPQTRLCGSAADTQKT